MFNAKETERREWPKGPFLLADPWRVDPVLPPEIEEDNVSEARFQWDLGPDGAFINPRKIRPRENRVEWYPDLLTYPYQPDRKPFNTDFEIRLLDPHWHFWTLVSEKEYALILEGEKLHSWAEVYMDICN